MGANAARAERAAGGELREPPVSRDELIRNDGGEPIQAPSLREVPLADQHEALAFGEHSSPATTTS